MKKISQSNVESKKSILNHSNHRRKVGSQLTLKIPLKFKMDQRIYFQWDNLANKVFIAPQNLLISWIDLRADCSMNSAAKLHKCSKFIFRKLKWMEQCEQKFQTTTIEWTFKWPSQRRRKWSGFPTQKIGAMTRSRHRRNSQQAREPWRPNSHEKSCSTRNNLLLSYFRFEC